jgi:hypothetical protein
MVGQLGPDYSIALAKAWFNATTAVNTTTVALTLANTEYYWDAPIGGLTVKKFTMKLRDLATWRLAFVTGKVAAPTDPYVTVPANAIYWEDGLNLTAYRIYFASPVATKVMEIIVWQ